MKLSSTLACAFAVLASTSPVAQRNQAQNGIQQLATFDDLTGIPALSQINPVGTYKGLKYQSFNVLQQGLLGIQTTGVRPRSGRQVAANSITGTILTGGPNITPAAPNKAFDLESLYLACVVNSVSSVTGLPQQCTIAFTAYKKGSKAPFQTVNKQFDPTNPVTSDMRKAEFPKSWTGLDKVEVAVVQATTTEPLNALFIDDVKYKLQK